MVNAIFACFVNEEIIVMKLMTFKVMLGEILDYGSWMIFFEICKREIYLNNGILSTLQPYIINWVILIMDRYVLWQSFIRETL